MKTKTKEETKRFGSWYFCQKCSQDVGELSHEQMIAHLKDIHGIDTKGLKVSKSMQMHMDGDNWFSSQYEITITDDLKLTQYSCHKRSKEDQAYWR